MTHMWSQVRSYMMHEIIRGLNAWDHSIACKPLFNECCLINRTKQWVQFSLDWLLQILGNAQRRSSWLKNLLGTNTLNKSTPPIQRWVPVRLKVASWGKKKILNRCSRKSYNVLIFFHSGVLLMAPSRNKTHYLAHISVKPPGSSLGMYLSKISNLNAYQHIKKFMYPITPKFCSK